MWASGARTSGLPLLPHLHKAISKKEILFHESIHIPVGQIHPYFAKIKQVCHHGWHYLAYILQLTLHLTSTIPSPNPWGSFPIRAPLVLLVGSSSPGAPRPTLLGGAV